MTLARQVARVTRTAFLVVAVAALINMAMLAYLNFHLENKAVRAADAGRELWLAHQAMLDQEAGLRAFLITGDEETLELYLEGRRTVGEQLDAARVALAGNDDVLALVDAQDERRQAWTSQWADRAVRLGESVPSQDAGVDLQEFVTEGLVLFDDYRAAYDGAEQAVSALREDTGAERDRVVKGSLALQVAVLCAGLLIVSRQLKDLRGAVLEPVQGLLDTIGELRDGNLAARSRPHGPAELRAVGDGLDELAEALATERAGTERRARELRDARRDAEDANAAKSAFLATMSHEIRTPMNAVVGMTGLLLDSPLDDEQREYAETVRQSGDALLTIVNDVLDFSKIESGQLELEHQAFVLRDCVESSLDLVAAQATAKGLDLVAQIDAAVPPVVEGDVTRLRQVLVNLLGNAVKFTEAGEVLVSVTAEPAGPDGRPVLSFAVRDSGMGIPADRMDRLFRSFSQVDSSTTRTHGGSGLGLAISLRLAEAMGGRLDVTSEVGTGSTFTLVAPFTPGMEVEDRVRVAPAQLPGKRALVIDDNSTNRRILRAQLEAWGMAVDDEERPAEALDRVRGADAPHDIAILDMHMPDMDGAELARRLRGLPGWQEVPLVLLTSLGDRVVVPEVPDLVHLTKPVKAAAMRAVVARALGSTEPVDDATPRPQRVGRLRILLAEDNGVNQRVAVLMLERLGQRPVVVSNGAEAVEALRNAAYDLVLMDVQMPVMDGLEATRRIRADLPADRQPRIVAMTANALVEDREASLDAGMDDHLAKPVRAEELAAVLARVTTRSVPTVQPAPAPAPEGPAVDAATLNALTQHLGPGAADFRDALVSAWRRESRHLLERLDAAATAGDRDGVSAVTHSLRSSSASLGALDLATLCGSIEDAVRTGEPLDLVAAASQVHLEVARADDSFSSLV